MPRKNKRREKMRDEEARYWAERDKEDEEDKERGRGEGRRRSNRRRS